MEIEGPNQKPLTIKPYPMKIRDNNRQEQIFEM